MSEGEIRGYHYTHRQTYEARIHNYGLVGQTSLLDEIRDTYLRLTRRKNFRVHDRRLPLEYYKRVVFALLEPEPESWLDNSEFPLAWARLMKYVGSPNFWFPKDTVLVSFEVRPNDNAFVFDRAHVRSKDRRLLERYRSYIRYFESRVPVFDYDGSYCLPELVIWGRIDADRIRLEEMSPPNKRHLGGVPA